VQFKHGTYYFVKTNCWTPLGKTLPDMYRAYALLLDENPLRTMADLCDKYAVEVLPQKAQKTQRNQALYIKRIRAAFGHMKPAEVRPKDMYQYVQHRAKSTPTTANRELEVLKHMFKKAVQWGVVDENPGREVEKVRLQKRTRYVEDGEFNTVHSLASPTLQVAMDLAVLTGLRRGDLLRLTRENLTDDGILITPAKTRDTSGKTLLIEWSEELRAVIDRAKQLRPQVRQPIIATLRGKPYTGEGFNTNWQRLMKKALKNGLIEPFRFHDLRAKSASDDTAEAASERLGHASRATTDRFYRRRPARVKPLR
jgi:integrase